MGLDGGAALRLGGDERGGNLGPDERVFRPLGHEQGHGQRRLTGSVLRKKFTPPRNLGGVPQNEGPDQGVGDGMQFTVLAQQAKFGLAPIPSTSRAARAISRTLAASVAPIRNDGGPRCCTCGGMCPRHHSAASVGGRCCRSDDESRNQCVFTVNIGGVIQNPPCFGPFRWSHHRFLPDYCSRGRGFRRRSGCKVERCHG